MKRSNLAGRISLGSLKLKQQQHSLITSLLEVRNNFICTLFLISVNKYDDNDDDNSRAVYPYLPLAANAPRTIWGDFIKSLTDFSIQKSIINCCQMSFPSQNTPKSMSAGASTQTPLEEFTALPQPSSGFKGPLHGRRGTEEREKDSGTGREGNGGERGNGEGRGNGQSSGIAPWLLHAGNRVTPLDRS